MDYISVFRGEIISENVDVMIKGAMDCLDHFAHCFEEEDLAGMDGCCHFPHYILSGEQVICWETPGQLTMDFFSDLKKKGFFKTIVDYKDIILVSENKIHLKYGYSRLACDGTVMSKHDNVWILTYENGEWGIKFRSY